MLRPNAKGQDPITINDIDVDVEDADRFVYLGAIVDNSGGPEQDVRRRLEKARSTFHRFSIKGVENG